MLDRLALWIANNLHDSLSERRRNTYELQEKDFKNFHNRVKFLIILFLLIILLIPISYIFNIKNELLFGSIAFFFMRYWNNGHHFKSTDICFIVTFIAIIFIPIINNFIGNHYLILSIFSLISIIIFSPFRKQNTLKKFYIKKIVTSVICILCYFLGSVFIIAVFIQSIDLIHNPKNKRRWCVLC